MQRVWVVGNAGSGKTTLAAALAARLEAPHLEIDAVHHQRDWEPLPVAELRARVTAVVAADRWVVDGNYRAVADLVQERADTIVWIDLTRATVMRQLVTRTLRRIVTREELWNGNRERWRNFFSLDPVESVIAWAWSQHAAYVERYVELGDAAPAAGIRFVRLRSRAEVRDFVAAASPA